MTEEMKLLIWAFAEVETARAALKDSFGPLQRQATIETLDSALANLDKLRALLK